MNYYLKKIMLLVKATDSPKNNRADCIPCTLLPSQAAFQRYKITICEEII